MPLPPTPRYSSVLEQMKQWTIGRDWGQWFDQLQALVNTTPASIGNTTQTAQSAALAATPLTSAPVTGLYRVSWYLRITQAATTSSAVQVTVRWTDGGVAQSSSGSNVTGNTTTSRDHGDLLVQADAGTSITIETTYSSTGATAMQFALRARVEQVP
jgi:hypothetical protein